MGDERWTIYVCRKCETAVSWPDPGCDECGGEIERIEVVPASELSTLRQALERIAKGGYRGASFIAQQTLASTPKPHDDKESG